MNKPFLILPVENQVRELDAKLLLACLAAQEGHRSLIGWKNLIDFRLGRLPPSIYFAKSITDRNMKMLRIKRKLGHYVIAWDEEAVVHYPPEIYYVRRIGANALKLIDLLVAWGEDNRELLEGYPEFSEHEKIRVLGNPRADLLRPEMSVFFKDQVEALRQAHGQFILINTNFGSINGYTDGLNLLRRDPQKNGEWVPGRGSVGMPLEYATGLFHYRTKVFDAFKEMVPRLAAAFPGRKIILRPHPAENHAQWREHLSGLENVEVLGDGNVVPWLLACHCLVQNGCTTAVEGYLLGTKIVSFVPIEDERYEFALPNKLGRRVSDTAEVIKTIEQGFDDGDDRSKEKHDLVTRFICSLEGDLASRRILDTVNEAAQSLEKRRVSMTRFSGFVDAEYRALKKGIKRWTGSERYDPRFMRQRFPELTVGMMQEKASELSRLVGNTIDVRIRQRETDLFEVYGD